MNQIRPASQPGISKVVIPVAGLGTRFLPATKATPKEILPVVDKPAVQYVVEEAVAAGLDDILFVTGRNKGSLEDHFDRSVELEQALAAKGDTERLALVQEATDLAHIHYVRQGSPMGLGHAVLMAASHVGSEPFAVMLGDDLIDPRNPVLERMTQLREQFGGSVLCLMEVPPADISLYGCVAFEPTAAADVVRVTGLVEKPEAAAAPSNYAIIGRYLLDAKVLEVLARTEPGKGGEIQLTDAIAELVDLPAAEGGGVHGLVFSGRRYDTGDRHGYLTTVIQLACEREDLGPRLREWLQKYVSVELSNRS